MSRQFAKAVKAFVDAGDLTIADLKVKTGLSETTCRQFVKELEEVGLLEADKSSEPYIYEWKGGDE